MENQNIIFDKKSAVQYEFQFIQLSFILLKRQLKYVLNLMKSKLFEIVLKINLPH